jgi:hypothetical protein
MTVWFVAAVPVLIMFFALAMERLENRLRHLTVQENEVEEFLQAARPEEVRVLFGSGIGGALELFRLRRLSRHRSTPQRGATQRRRPTQQRPSHVTPHPARVLNSTDVIGGTGIGSLTAGPVPLGELEERGERPLGQGRHLPGCRSGGG